MDHQCLLTVFQKNLSTACSSEKIMLISLWTHKINIRFSSWLNLFQSTRKCLTFTCLQTVIDYWSQSFGVSLRKALSQNLWSSVRLKRKPGASKIWFQGKIYCFTNTNMILGLNRKMTSDIPRICLVSGELPIRHKTYIFRSREAWK